MTIIYVQEQKDENGVIENYRCTLTQNYEECGQLCQQVLEVKSYRYITGVQKYFKQSGAYSIIFPKKEAA
jgi:ribosomal protein S17E